MRSQFPQSLAQGVAHRDHIAARDCRNPKCNRGLAIVADDFRPGINIAPANVGHFFEVELLVYSADEKVFEVFERGEFAGRTERDEFLANANVAAVRDDVAHFQLVIYGGAGNAELRESILTRLDIDDFALLAKCGDLGDVLY